MHYRWKHGKAHEGDRRAKGGRAGRANGQAVLAEGGSRVTVSPRGSAPRYCTVGYATAGARNRRPRRDPGPVPADPVAKANAEAEGREGKEAGASRGGEFKEMQDHLIPEKKQRKERRRSGDGERMTPDKVNQRGAVAQMPKGVHPRNRETDEARNGHNVTDITNRHFRGKPDTGIVGDRAADAGGSSRGGVG